MATSLLFVGDIHLGRRPARLPSDLEDSFGLSRAELTPAAAWREVVRFARTEEVDALILAGDVVEADNALFEAFGRLRKGIDDLIEDGIQVLAVAGNHDVDALPRLADLIDGFRLLGRGGKWESAAVHSNGKTVAHILGWSFPTSHFTSSPLASFQPPDLPGKGIPRFGVLHADLAGGKSAYAPVTQGELVNAGLDGWFLGHVHKPSLLQQDRPIGYLGSLVGLDPTETGPHGPWLMRIDEENRFELEQIALAPLRWERVVVDVEHLASATDLLELLVQNLDRLHRAVVPDLGRTKAVGTRLELTGATALRAELRRRLDAELAERLCSIREGVIYFVDSILDRSRPAIDLLRCAAEGDPPGLLARLILSLEGGGEEAAAIVQRAQRALPRIVEESGSTLPRLGDLSDDHVRELLISSGLQALEALLAQADSKKSRDGAA
jgi:DNA repair exonuclease SbcCD nuclease subunit